MKKAIHFLLAIAMVFSMAAFGGCVNGGKNASGDTITFMHMWPEHEATMNRILAKFTEKEGITVKASITPYDQMEQVLQAAERVCVLYPLHDAARIVYRRRDGGFVKCVAR